MISSRFVRQSLLMLCLSIDRRRCVRAGGGKRGVRTEGWSGGQGRDMGATARIW